MKQSARVTKITAAWLKGRACPTEYAAFKKMFPRGLALTEAGVRAAWKKYNARMPGYGADGAICWLQHELTLRYRADHCHGHTLPRTLRWLKLYRAGELD